MNNKRNALKENINKSKRKIDSIDRSYAINKRFKVKEIIKSSALMLENSKKIKRSNIPKLFEYL